MKQLLSYTMFFWILVNSVLAQQVIIPAGSQFAASPGKQFWWGRHWRKEWLAPVPFTIFDMDTTAGGLTALKKGGGHETKTLRLLGKNGKEYVLRTMDKSLDVLVPEEFKGSFVNDIINDQISTAHPYGPLAVAALSCSIGIMHTNPVIVFVPGNPRLGEFSNDFANRLCLFEERPSGQGWDHTGLTRFSNDVINSEKLFVKLAESNKRQVDQKEFLKIRLFDMLINDWDRHEDQWVWTENKKDGKTIYQAFARDRDQAFSKADGVNLFLLSRPWALRSIQNLNANIHDVIGTNLSATWLDKEFTNELTEQDWKITISALQALLTDSVINHALQHMPEEIYRLSGNFLYKRLCQRRDNMLSFGMHYFNILNKDVTIRGTDQPEIITINKLNNNTTEITLEAVTKKHQRGDTIYHRIFSKSITDEITVYGLGGNDQFIFTGLRRNGILVRVLGGDINDLFLDSTIAGNLGKKSKIFAIAPSTPFIYKNFQYKTSADTAFTNYHRNSFQYDWWIPLVIPGYNPDDGFVIGAGFIYKKQKWQKVPFGWQQTFGVDYAASTGAYSLYYKGIFKQVFGKWDLGLSANYKAPAYVVNFYGFGNDTKLQTSEKSFYRVRARSLFFNPTLSRAWGKNIFSTGLILNTVKAEFNPAKYISQPGVMIDSSVFQNKYFAGLNIVYSINTVDNIKFPTRGVHYEAGASYLMNLKESKRKFINLQSSVSFYYSPFTHITIAHRTGAATIIGDYEFYQANTLGGTENLRGYWRTRFTGQTTFYQNTDVRVQLAQLKGYVLRGKLGIYVFFDDGRVWVEDEHSDFLHTGFGGGIYFIPYNSLAINLVYGSSKEVNVFSIHAGFLF